MFTLTGLVADIDGTKVYKKTLSGKKDDPARTGIELAEDLLSQGAAQILEKLKADA